MSRERERFLPQILQDRSHTGRRPLPVLPRRRLCHQVGAPCPLPRRPSSSSETSRPSGSFFVMANCVQGGVSSNIACSALPPRRPPRPLRQDLEVVRPLSQKRVERAHNARVKRATRNACLSAFGQGIGSFGGQSRSENIVARSRQKPVDQLQHCRLVSDHENGL